MEAGADLRPPSCPNCQRSTCDCLSAPGNSIGEFLALWRTEAERLSAFADGPEFEGLREEALTSRKHAST